MVGLSPSTKPTVNRNSFLLFVLVYTALKIRVPTCSWKTNPLLRLAKAEEELPEVARVKV